MMPTGCADYFCQAKCVFSYHSVKALAVQTNLHMCKNHTCKKGKMSDSFGLDGNVYHLTKHSISVVIFLLL